MSLQLIDRNLKRSPYHYVGQCILATLTISVMLLFLDVFTETAIIAALGASVFTVFTMPRSYAAEPRRVIGGYGVGVIIGMLCYLSMHASTHLISEETSLVLYGSLAVGLAILAMAATNTEHAPAAGIALGLVINTWSAATVVFIIMAMLWMVAVRHLLRRRLINLTAPLV
jgi:CBS-domain-containing membrane protein